jgi:hypothetical protein
MHGILTIFDISLAISLTLTPIEVIWNNGSIPYSCWLYSPMLEEVYQKINGEQWMCWVRHHDSRRLHHTRAASNLFIARQPVSYIPEDAVPASVHSEGNMVRLSSCPSTMGTYPSDNRGAVSGTLFTSSSDKDLSLLGYYIYNIHLHNGLIVSDGSYREGKASFAFLAQPKKFQCDLGDVNLDQLIYGRGHVDGSEHDTNAYRAELAGILSAITYTNRLCKDYKIAQGACTLCCDNMGALYASFGHKRPHPKWSSFDLVQQIRLAILSSLIQWTYKHVFGHQDSSCKFSSLDFIAQGNVIVDFLASTYEHGHPAESVSPTYWTPKIHGSVIGGDVEKQLVTKIYRPLMIDRWSQMFCVPNCTTTFDWDLFFHSFQSQRKTIQPFLTKFYARILPVGTNLKRRLHSDHDNCPCCGDTEDHNHILTCTHPQMAVTYDECVHSISSFVGTNMDQSLGQDILHLLHIFRSSTSDVRDPTDACLQQYSYGPRAFYAGLWLPQWRDRHEHYLRSIKSQRKSMTWMIHLIHRIQEIPYRLWTTRNQILHHSNNFDTTLQHTELDSLIDNIILRKPHSRLMDHCDNFYFAKYSSEQLKNMTLHRKINWVAGANLILTKYKRAITVQSAKFQSFFQWDRG